MAEPLADIVAQGAARGMHRLIRIAVHPYEARAVVIDDFHHFRVALAHDGEAVTAARSQSVRFPYSLCPSAGDALAALAGLRLSSRVFDISAALNARLQCTHQFDLAALTIAAAARGMGRTYHILVTDPHGGIMDARLVRDDGFRMSLSLDDQTIVAPPEHAGIRLDQGFTSWAAGLADEDMAEAALVLRRAHMVQGGRMRIDEINSRKTALPRASCYVMQPERAAMALCIPTLLGDGSLPHMANADDERWLAGSDA
jgi:hypothetical protein